MTSVPWISKDFEEVRKPKQAYIAKAIITTILVLLAIGFAVTLYDGSKHDNEKATFIGGALSVSMLFLCRTLMMSTCSGILEWVIRFRFVLYLLTFYFN